MATTDALTSRRAAARGEDFQYRPLSSGAVASLVFGLLSTLIFVVGRDSPESAWMLSLIPIIGFILGWRALAHMRANADQFSGGALAKAGAALSAVCLVAGVGFSSYVYATEVPEGYVRTSFLELRPDEVELRNEQLIPPDIAKLDGEKVFIKGFIRPDSTKYTRNIRQFLLVRDSNQCCFGDISNVKYYDQVAVVMTDQKTVDYRTGLFRIGGTLRVHPEFAGDGAPYPAYVLEADYSK